MLDESTLLSQKIADFIVKAEFESQSFSSKEYRLPQQFDLKNKQIDEQLRFIESEILHIKAIITRTGAAQWYRETQALLKQTKTDISLLESIYEQTCQAVKTECERLNHASMNTVKCVSQMLSEAKHHGLQEITQQKSLELQQLSEHNMRMLEKTVGGFRWKNLSLAVLLSFLVTIIVSLYINDKWPWQAHAEVLNQRKAGEVLISSWKNLSEADKTLILDSA